MLFLLATPEYNNVQSNTTKVRVHLRTGIAEIFDQHQDLMGKVENNIVEVETNFENKFEKFIFVLQDAVFIVSNQGFDTTTEDQDKQTSVYVYAKKVLEVNSKTSIEGITSEYEAKKLELEAELEKQDSQVSNSKILLLQEDTEFLKKSLAIVKGLKS